jgi:hypothetical protein
MLVVDLLSERIAVMVRGPRGEKQAES